MTVTCWVQKLIKSNKIKYGNLYEMERGGLSVLFQRNKFAFTLKKYYYF